MERITLADSFHLPLGAGLAGMARRMFRADKVAAVYPSGYRGVSNSDVKPAGLKKCIPINGNAVGRRLFNFHDHTRGAASVYSHNAGLSSYERVQVDFPLKSFIRCNWIHEFVPHYSALRMASFFCFSV